MRVKDGPFTNRQDYKDDLFSLGWSAGDAAFSALLMSILLETNLPTAKEGQPDQTSL